MAPDRIAENRFRRMSRIHSVLQASAERRAQCDLKVSARDCEQDFTASVTVSVPFWSLPAQYPYFLLPILFDPWTLRPLMTLPE